MKKSVLAFLAVLTFAPLAAQTPEEIATKAAELKAEIAPKADSIAALQGRVDALQAELDALPGWKLGAFGTIGGSISQFNNFFAQGFPNNRAGNIGITFNAYANEIQEKYFWRNSLNVNFGWVRFDNTDDDTDDDGFRQANDVFNLSSLYGRNLSAKWAVSGLAEYRTTVLSNFNDPGYLDLGVGFTWTPAENLVVVIHPANYNFVFSRGDSVFSSSFGAKVVADYTRSFGAIGFKSNFSGFFSYESSNLNNWTWTNSFSYTLWKVIGVGFDFALRDNRQETLNFIQNRALTPDPTATFDSIDNQLQTYWTLGLSYAF